MSAEDLTMLTANLRRLDEMRAEEKRTGMATFAQLSIEDWFGHTEDYIRDLLARVQELEREKVYRSSGACIYCGAKETE